MFKCAIATFDTALSNRLLAVLDGMADLVRADPDLDSLIRVVSASKPDLVLIDIDSATGMPDDLPKTVIALHDVDPDHAVIAIGDETMAQSVLMAIRAGARDFVSRDSSVEQLLSSVAGHLGRAPRRDKAETGNLTGVIGGESAAGGSSFAINYAVTCGLQKHDVLLIDCNLPSTEAGAALDLDFTYTIRDALQDLSRLDRTLLTSTLSRHGPSGVHVLPLALAGEDIGDLTPSAIVSMLRVMRGLFGETIINIGGIRHAGLLTELLQSATRLYLVLNQKFTTLKSCKELLTQLGPSPETLQRVTLIVDDYHDEITLTEQQITAAMGLTHSARLPAARAALVNALNRGNPLVLAEPRHPYARAIAKIAGTPKLLPSAIVVPERRKVTRRFFGRLAPGAS
jgi:pilus assembly protein CpaE